MKNKINRKNKKAFSTIGLVVKIVFYLVLVLVIYLVFSNFITVSKKSAYRLFDTTISKYVSDSGTLFHPAISTEHKHFYYYNVKEVLTFANPDNNIGDDGVNPICTGFIQTTKEQEDILPGYSLVLKQVGEDITLSFYDGYSNLAATDKEPILKNKKLCILNINNDNEIPMKVSQIKISFGNKYESSYVTSESASIQKFSYEPYDSRRIKTLLGSDSIRADDIFNYDYFFKFLTNNGDELFCIEKMKGQTAEHTILTVFNDYGVHSETYYDDLMQLAFKNNYAGFCNVAPINNLKLPKECYYSNCDSYSRFYFYTGWQDKCLQYSESCNKKCFVGVNYQDKNYKSGQGVGNYLDTCAQCPKECSELDNVYDCSLATQYCNLKCEFKENKCINV